MGASVGRLARATLVWRASTAERVGAGGTAVPQAAKSKVTAMSSAGVKRFIGRAPCYSATAANEAAGTGAAPELRAKPDTSTLSRMKMQAPRPAAESKKTLA